MDGTRELRHHGQFQRLRYHGQFHSRRGIMDSAIEKDVMDGTRARKESWTVLGQ